MSHPHILIHEMSFYLPSGKPLLNNLSVVFSSMKTGLVGKNGIGKSTLIKLINGEIQPNSGSIQLACHIAYVPQNPVILPDMTVASLLGAEEKINALHRIKQGSIDIHDYAIVNEDWDIEQRLTKQLGYFGLVSIELERKLMHLSGGELTRLLLTNAFYSEAEFILLDEPTNHLDASMRQQLYRAISEWPSGMMVISHDRELLNRMDEIIELNPSGFSHFGGNYDHYRKQKDYFLDAKEQELHDAKKLFRKTKHSIQSTKEKHEQRQAKGEELRRRNDQPKIMLDAMKNRSTASKGKMLTRHDRMLNQVEENLKSAKESHIIQEIISVELPKTKVPNGKVILAIENLAYFYPEAQSALIQDFNLRLQGAERIALSGNNGSGKTTLIKIIMKELKPTCGKIYIGTQYVSYLDQTASLLKPHLTLVENFMLMNIDATENHAYCALAQFLFKNTAAEQQAANLSGGEKLRALLACTLLSDHPPQLLILDEPTNHLDLESVESIESALKNYQGAMIVISHDHVFLQSIGIERTIYAPFTR